ncbi:MAG TPA: T9SS type A sorting domain-containing protein [Bacteroidetes bacterium]|nr:T9SS type A sorting domain-containing protein [Bacteroidota bacterium]
MKNKILIKVIVLLILNFFIVNNIEISAQSTIADDNQISYAYVDQICYKTTRIEKLRVFAELNVETLTHLEKMKFQTKQMIQEHKEYFSETGYYTHRIVYDTSINFFAKWYKVPEITVFDNTGITNYYEKKSKYYNDGWPGGGRDSSYYGNYYTNIRTGEKTYVERYSENARQAYLEQNQVMKENGVLYGKVFVVPTASTLDVYSNMGYTVVVTATDITVYNSEIQVVWDIVNKIITKVWYENGVAVEKVRNKYSYNKELHVDVLTEIAETTPREFENGDCYEEFTITYFRDYSLCGSQLKLRNQSKAIANETTELIISPNPVLDIMEIQFPEITESSYMELMTLTGKVINKVKLTRGLSEYKIDISDLVAGTYIVKVKNSNRTLIKKFVKQ